MEINLLQALRSGRVLVMDGAMGTELQRAGIRPGECHELWNILHPDRVQEIHEAYVRAGAQVLITNTFQANPAALAKHHLREYLPTICENGVRLARQAFNGHGYVLGDIGPFDYSGSYLVDIAKSFHGIDGLLLETLSEPPPVERLGPDPPVLVAFTFCHFEGGELQTIERFTPEAIAEWATQSGICALGVNCGRDVTMLDVVEIIRRFKNVTDLPLFARPNAGPPIQGEGHWIYPQTAKQMAAVLPELLSAGVAMVGGCCGTTVDHIEAFRRVVDAS